MSGLRDLGLKCNPLANKKTYRNTVFQKLPGLLKLDGTAVSEKDHENATTGAKELTWEIIVNYVKSTKKSF